MDQGVAPADFDAIEHDGGYALHWQAHDLKYGIRNIELLPLTQGRWVLVNGSRAYLSQCTALYPGLTVLHITADAQVLRTRLLNRGRESDDMIQARIHRAAAAQKPANCTWIEVLNHSTIDQTGKLMLQLMQQLPGWPIDPGL